MPGMIRIEGATFTPQQIDMLRQLAKGPVNMENTTGFEDRTLGKLEERGLATLEATEATITPAGRTLIGKAPSSTPPAAKRAEKERKPKTSRRRRADRESPPPTDAVGDSAPRSNVLDLDKLRAQVEERYRSDLAAIERLREVAAEIAS